MRIIIVAFLCYFGAITSLNIKCKYRYHESKLTDLNLDGLDHVRISKLYTCFGRQYAGDDNEKIETVSGKHVSDKSNADVKAITFKSMEIPQIPRGLGKIFPNLISVVVDKCNLNEILLGDLRQFKRMIFFSAQGNNLANINSNLFMHNRIVKVINFADNQIRSVGATFANHLPKLEVALFSNNPCIDKNFLLHDELRRKLKMSQEKMSKELKESCPPGLDTEVDELNDRFVGIVMANEKPNEEDEEYYEYMAYSEYYDYYDYYDEFYAKQTSSNEYIYQLDNEDDEGSLLGWDF